MLQEHGYAATRLVIWILNVIGTCAGFVAGVAAAIAVGGIIGGDEGPGWSMNTENLCVGLAFLLAGAVVFVPFRLVAEMYAIMRDIAINTARTNELLAKRVPRPKVRGDVGKGEWPRSFDAGD